MRICQQNRDSYAPRFFFIEFPALSRGELRGQTLDANNICFY